MSIIFRVLFGFIALLAASTIFGSFYTIDQGERGVILRNGAISGVAEPGMNFKIPFVDHVVDVSVQNHVQSYDKMQAYSKDQQPTELRLSVSYHVPASQVTEAYAEYGGLGGVVERILDRRVFEQVKNVFGQYNAVTAIQERARLNTDMEAAVRKSVKGPIVIDSLQIENIDFSDAYEQSIENRMLAEVEVQKLRQNAEREKVQAQITVTQANAKADAVRAEAQANADAVRLNGDAQADAIKARAAALGQNPLLVDLTKAEKWDGKLPETMVPSSTVPFLNIH
jgi:regulator of protease activity HflC (stomatin/prohibitin superfamily)